MKRRIAWLFGACLGCAAAPALPAAPSSAPRAPADPDLPPAASSSQLQALRYTFRLDPAFQRLAAELCFRGRAPERLVYGARSSVPFLRSPRLVSEAAIPLPAAKPLPVVADHIELGGVPDDACIAYEVDLQAALEADHLLVAYPCEGALVTSVELFLWRPVRRPAGLITTARFELPDGMRVSLPWSAEAGEYSLDEAVFAFTGHALFGRFDALRAEVPGGWIDAAVPAGFSPAQHRLIVEWLATAGQIVASVGGRFPQRRSQVIVLPTSANLFPIRFGHTGRSGGASVLFFLPTDVDRAALREDWIAIHEFAHLLHPFVRRQDAWLSEGLATYLQEVLRVRAGLLPAADAWRRLYEGAQRGRDGHGGLADETRRMAFEGNYQRVYWAGAAIALMADVELRRRSQGQRSLDGVLAEVGAQPGVMRTPASAASLIGALDRAAGEPVFEPIVKPYLTGTAMPDLALLYRELGLLDRRGELQQPTAAAPLAAVRDAIMAPRIAREDLQLFGAEVAN